MYNYLIKNNREAESISKIKRNFKINEILMTLIYKCYTMRTIVL